MRLEAKKLKLNEHEMEMITNSKDPRTVALQMASYGVREVVTTLGSFGSLIYADKQFYEIPAYEPRQVVDATGCGDTYSAGYLYMRSLGADIEASGKFAAAMCTSKLEHNGPTMGSKSSLLVFLFFCSFRLRQQQIQHNTNHSSESYA